MSTPTPIVLPSLPRSAFRRVHDRSASRASDQPKRRRRTRLVSTRFAALPLVLRHQRHGRRCRRRLSGRDDHRHPPARHRERRERQQLPDRQSSRLAPWGAWKWFPPAGASPSTIAGRCDPRPTAGASVQLEPGPAGATAARGCCPGPPTFNDLAASRMRPRQLRITTTRLTPTAAQRIRSMPTSMDDTVMIERNPPR